MGKITTAYKFFVTKPEEMTQLGRPRYRWDDNTKIDLKEIAMTGWTEFWLSTAPSGTLM
jgi:hypothetical protein